MASKMIERLQICQGFLPVDMSVGANAGDYVCMKNYSRFGILFFKAVGTAGDDPTITVLQATDVAAGTNKALTFTEIWVKQAATNLLAVGTFTKTTQTAANTYTNLTLAEQAALIWIEFAAEELDTDNGYDCVGASIAKVGTNAQLGSMVYIGEPKYIQGINLSAIVD